MCRAITILGLCVALWGCPPGSEPRDGGADAASADATLHDATTVDAGQNDLAARDSSTAQDSATAHDAQTVPDSAVVGDAGSSCLLFDACTGVVASGATHSLAVSSLGLGGAHTLALGDTLATVRTHMSGVTETIASYNSFALMYCTEGLVLYFADNLSDTAGNEGQLTDSDTLYKITAVGNFTGATDTVTPLALGDPLATVTAALGSADFIGSGTSVAGDNGQFLYYTRGVAVLVIADSVTSLSLFQPQPGGAINASVNFGNGTIGGVSVTHNALGSVAVPSGSTLTQVRAVFGATPDADGDTTVNIGGTDVGILMLSYSALGLRFSGTARQYSGINELTGDQRKVFTAVITPPFQGLDNGIGIGTERATIQARWGAPYASDVDTEGRTLHKYNVGSRKAGVMYAQDAACVERAVLFFVNLIDLD
ncbi:MAG: hypothetical protein ABIJ09_21055 [Pseudomonadota bacterium]